MIKIIAFLLTLLIGGAVPSYTNVQSVLRPAALLIPGFEGGPQDIAPIADALRKRGFIVQVYTPPWGDEGESCDDYLDRAKGAYQLLLQQSDIDPSQIMVYGTSLGAYTAARLVGVVSTQPRWIVLHAPANYPDSDCKHPIKNVIMTASHEGLVRWRNEPRGACDTASLCAVSSYQGTMLVIASGDDDSVPLMTSLNYERAAAPSTHPTLMILPGAGHMPDLPHQVLLGEMIINWLDGRGVPCAVSGM